MSDSEGSNDIPSIGGGGDPAGSGEDGNHDVDDANRRSKNRVNARRSRERRKLMLDALQSEHWRLHQKKQRIEIENSKLREAVATLKSLQRNPATLDSQQTTSNNNPQISQALAPLLSKLSAPNPAPPVAAAAANPAAPPDDDMSLSDDENDTTTTGSANKAQTTKDPSTSSKNDSKPPASQPAAAPAPQSASMTEMLVQQLLNGSQQGSQSTMFPPAAAVPNPPNESPSPAGSLVASLLLSKLTGAPPPPAPAPPPPPPQAGSNAEALLAVILGALITSVIGSQQNEMSPVPTSAPTPITTAPPNNNVLGLLGMLLSQQPNQETTPAPAPPPPPPPPEVSTLASLAGLLNSSRSNTSPPASNIQQQLQGLLQSLGQQSQQNTQLPSGTALPSRTGSEDAHRQSPPIDGTTGPSGGNPGQQKSVSDTTGQQNPTSQISSPPANSAHQQLQGLLESLGQSQQKKQLAGNNLPGTGSKDAQRQPPLIGGPLGGTTGQQKPTSPISGPPANNAQQQLQDLLNSLGQSQQNKQSSGTALPSIGSKVIQREPHLIGITGPFGAITGQQNPVGAGTGQEKPPSQISEGNDASSVLSGDCSTSSKRKKGAPPKNRGPKRLKNDAANIDQKSVNEQSNNIGRQQQVISPPGIIGNKTTQEKPQQVPAPLSQQQAPAPMLKHIMGDSSTRPTTFQASGGGGGMNNFNINVQPGLNPPGITTHSETAQKNMQQAPAQRQVPALLSQQAPAPMLNSSNRFSNHGLQQPHPSAFQASGGGGGGNNPFNVNATSIAQPGANNVQFQALLASLGQQQSSISLLNPPTMPSVNTNKNINDMSNFGGVNASLMNNSNNSTKSSTSVPLQQNNTLRLQSFLGNLGQQPNAMVNNNNINISSNSGGKQQQPPQSLPVNASPMNNNSSSSSTSKSEQSRANDANNNNTQLQSLLNSLGRAQQQVPAAPVSVNVRQIAQQQKQQQNPVNNGLNNSLSGNNGLMMANPNNATGRPTNVPQNAQAHLQALMGMGNPVGSLPFGNVGNTGPIQQQQRQSPFNKMMTNNNAIANNNNNLLMNLQQQGLPPGSTGNQAELFRLMQAIGPQQLQQPQQQRGTATGLGGTQAAPQQQQPTTFPPFALNLNSLGQMPQFQQQQGTQLNSMNLPKGGQGNSNNNKNSNVKK